jgi:hypothetical protein
MWHIFCSKKFKHRMIFITNPKIQGEREMKNIKKILLLGTASALLVFAGSAVSKANSITITAGDKIQLIGYNSQDNAGIMTYDVYKPDGSTLLGQINTFCIQDNVYINYGVMYKIESITDQVGINGNDTWKAGGNVIQEPGNINGTGTLNGAVDYLFHQYFIGSYNNTGLLNNPGEQADFQKLLWSLQGSGSQYDSPYNYQWEKDLAAYENPSSGLQNKSYDSVVLNIVGEDSNGKALNVQNQLYDPVPEPSTMLLFGAGLTGLASFVRRKRS